MEVEEEVAHLLHLLPTIKREEILVQLAKHHDATRPVRLLRIVNNFSERVLNRNQYINSDEYKIAFERDLLQLEWFFPDVNRNQIIFILETVGPIRNRSLIVAKLLQPDSERQKFGQKRYSENDINENPEDKEEIFFNDEELTSINDAIINGIAAYNDRSKHPHPEVNNIPYKPRLDAVNSTRTLPQEANNKPEKMNFTVEINDSPVPNKTPVKQNMHDFVGIPDSPIAIPEAVAESSQSFRSFLHAVNSKKTLLQEANDTPEKINFNIAIKDSPVPNKTPVNQNMHDFIEIPDSPVTNPEAVAGSSRSESFRAFLHAVNSPKKLLQEANNTPEKMNFTVESNDLPVANPEAVTGPSRSQSFRDFLHAVNSKGTLAQKANNSPEKMDFNVEINDAPVPNKTPVKPNMHDFVEILDSPVTDPDGLGPLPEDLAVTRPSTLFPAHGKPGPLNARMPPSPFHSNCLHYRPAPSNATMPPLSHRRGKPESFLREAPHTAQNNEPINMSPNTWRPLQRDSSDEDDGSILDALMDEFEENIEKIEPTLPPPPTNQDLPVNLAVDEKLVMKLMEVFPNVAPDYLRIICAGKQWSEGTFEQLMDTILTLDNIPTRPERPVSPEKEIEPQEQLAMLKSMFPDADPTYLERKVNELIGNKVAMTAFIEKAMDTKDYPTMKEYLRQQQLSAQHRQYTSEFKVEKFVEIFPDPVKFFENPEKKSNIALSDKYYIKSILRRKYNQLYVKDINYAIECTAHTNILAMVNYLETRLKAGAIKSVKTNSTITRPDSHNITIPLLQELAYFEHKEEILKYLEEKKDEAAKDRLEAKQLGLMQNCSCCFDDEVMPLDILTCTGGCRFCRECIKRSSEVAFGDGKINFPCLSDGCNEVFSLQMLQNVLDPKLFSKIAQKQAVAEVKAAGLEDLESCPFCDFANIPAPEDKIFRCLNPDCMKESCRLCKEPSHLPLRCDEVEKDEAVKARTFIENKMAEALIRECWKCGAKFIKEEGCNKMTCSCGAMMCYVCRQPVKNYKHFNGQGGDQFNLCPLYSDNILNNEKKVLEAAVEAKKQVDPAQLKSDPTVAVQNLADKIKKAEKKMENYQQRVAQVDDLVQNIVNNPMLPRLVQYDRVIAAVAAAAGPYGGRPVPVPAPVDAGLARQAAIRMRQEQMRRGRAYRGHRN
ncbi:unnamed protein product [Ceutorhynchus assimilis]|uniref:RING-type domain-containing protein n=1 Tax=Ceutorhynchus assimilis TaxID=467358 RepID=A0A9P0GK03_9CUCU|nr:unnamed protein product [Ceutorhynchus assimilis]